MDDDLKRIQDSLKGVFDLGKVVDCQAVIRMLVRHIHQERAERERADDRLKSLAFMVTRDDPKAASRAQELLAPHKRAPAEVMDGLMSMSGEMELAKAMSVEELATWVMNHVWSGLDITSRESAVLGELIERIRGTHAQPERG